MKNNRPVDRVPFYVAGAFVLALAVLHPLGVFYSIDNKWLDQMFRWRGMDPADSRITIVAIDDDSIHKIGQYPWPRGVYSKLLDKLFSGGAKVVGLDILFIDPSIPAEDRVLVDATKKWAERVVHSINMSPEVGTHYSFLKPFPALAAATKSVGVVNQIAIDPDDFIRKTFLMYGTSLDTGDWTKDSERQPSLGLRMLSLYEGKPVDDYVRDRNLLYLNVRGQHDREFYVRGPHGGFIRGVQPLFGIRRISAIKVLNGELSPKEREAINGGIIIVGSTVVGAYDHYPTPFTNQAPGPEVHATVIDNILNHRELHRVPGWTTLILVVGLAFFSSWTLFLSPLASALFVGSVLAGWILANFYAFSRHQILQFTAPTVALLGPFLVLLVRRTLLENQEKRFIKQTFGQFVAPEVVEDLTKEPGRVRQMMEGEKREMSVLFLDIAHFTTISEKMDPQALIRFLNRYLSGLSDVVHEHKGVVDKFIGDCIMAFWNAPLEQKDHRKQACLAAIECQEMMEKLNAKMDGAIPQKPAIRIGVNSGIMTVGLTGSEQKLQYTVIGDEVNLASRLEGANKFFGSRILVSEACYQGAKDAVEARELGRIRVVGKALPIRVYELLGRRGGLSDVWNRALPVYQEGLRAFSAREFAKAESLFTETLRILPKDGVAMFYQNISADYAASPPPESWDGIFNLAAK